MVKPILPTLLTDIGKNKEKYVVLFNPKAQKAEQGNASVDAPDF